MRVLPGTDSVRWCAWGGGPQTPSLRGRRACGSWQHALRRVWCVAVRHAQVSNEVQYLPTIYPGDSIFGFKWATPTARNCGLPGKA